MDDDNEKLPHSFTDMVSDMRMAFAGLHEQYKEMQAVGFTREEAMEFLIGVCRQQGEGQ